MAHWRFQQLSWWRPIKWSWPFLPRERCQGSHPIIPVDFGHLHSQHSNTGFLPPQEVMKLMNCPSFSSSPFDCDQVSSLNFASLSLTNDCYTSPQIANASTQKRLLSNSGWGNQETRKAYESLTSLAASQASSQRAGHPTSTCSDPQQYDCPVSDDEAMEYEANFWWMTTTSTNKSYK
jgi:hypothetical protein